MLHLAPFDHSHLNSLRAVKHSLTALRLGYDDAEERSHFKTLHSAGRIG